MWRHTPSGGLVGAILHGRGAYVPPPFGADRSARRILIQCRLYILPPPGRFDGGPTDRCCPHMLFSSSSDDETRLGVSLSELEVAPAGQASEEELGVGVEVGLRSRFSMARNSSSIALARLVMTVGVLFRVLSGLRRLLESSLALGVADDFEVRGRASGVVTWRGASSSSS